MNNWTLVVKKRRRCNWQKKHFDQLIAIWFSECVLFFDEQIVLFLNDFYQFSNFVLKKWKTKKEIKLDEKSKNVFINSAILLFLFKPLPLFFMLLYSQNFYTTCVFCWIFFDVSFIVVLLNFFCVFRCFILCDIYNI